MLYEELLVIHLGYSSIILSIKGDRSDSLIKGDWSASRGLSRGCYMIELKKGSISTSKGYQTSTPFIP